MSFSSNVKEELSKISNLANKQCVKAEFVGYAISCNATIKENTLRYSTESEYNINRFAKLLNNLAINSYNIELHGKSYVITSKDRTIFDILDIKKLHMLELLSDSEEKAFVRGTFLGSGSINNPQNKYHMEILIKNEQYADYLLQILNKYKIYFKKLNKSIYYSVYTKDGEEISKFLAFVGANLSVLKFEDIRVYRDMRNNVNRLVNCETANLGKTVGAAIKQIEAINIIKEKGKYAQLTDNLKEIAELRLNNPEISLTELGKMTNPPISKSGVNNRLKVIMKIANELINEN